MKRFKAHEADEVFDLVIVGGGIYGASMLYTAALNGISAVLLERNDFASATSAHSQKVIHGGLRYLQSLDITRVVESIREKQRFYRFFPHLVHPLPCALPTKGYGMKGNEALRLAFFLYTCLERVICRGKWGAHQDKQPRILSRREFLETFPDLREQTFRGGALWYDGLCREPERVIVSLLHSAFLSGAGIANYTEVIRFESGEDGESVALTVHDRIEQRSSMLHARRVALCTGPYFKEDLGLEPLPEVLRKMTIIRGINLVYRSFLKGGTSLGIKANTGRASRYLFFVPWKKYAIGGTHWQRVDQIEPEIEDQGDNSAEEFHQEVSQLFSSAEELPAPLRKLAGYVPGESDAAPGVEASRSVLSHYALVYREQNARGRIMQVVGVKFTTAFDVSLRALRKLFGNRELRDSMTFAQVPHGSGFSTTPEVEEQRYCRQYEGLLGKEQLEYLFGLLGTQLPHVVDQYLKDEREGSAPLDELGMYRGLSSYCVSEEMAYSLEDIIDRRLFPNTPELPPQGTLSAIAERMACLLQWDAEKEQLELNKVMGNR